MKKNVLVTGGAGFIGSHVVRHCMEMGFEVVVLDDLSGGFEDYFTVIQTDGDDVAEFTLRVE